MSGVSPTRTIPKVVDTPLVMVWDRGANRIHSTSTEDTQPDPTSPGNYRRRFSRMSRAKEENATIMTTKGSIDVEGGSGEDNIMLGFQNLSISCDDPPKHIVANVSGFVVKGTGKSGSETPKQTCVVLVV